MKVMTLLSPEGAAREVSLSIRRALEIELVAENVRTIDCASQMAGMRALLRSEHADLDLDLFNQYLLDCAVDFGADFVLVPALCPVTCRTLVLWKKCGISSVHWFFEDYRKASYWKEVYSYYTLFCGIQKSELEQSVRNSTVSWLFLPNAADEPAKTPLIPFSQRCFDIAFVGLPSPYRIEMLQALAEAGFKLTVAGKGWELYRTALGCAVSDPGWVDSNRMREIFQNSRIGLNLSVNNPEKERGSCQLSPRAFEIAGAGTMLVSEDLPLGKDFLLEVTAVVFRNKLECVENIKEILQNGIADELLYGIREIVRGKHTYRNRIRQIIEQLDL